MGCASSKTAEDKAEMKAKAAAAAAITSGSTNHALGNGKSATASSTVAGTTTTASKSRLANSMSGTTSGALNNNNNPNNNSINSTNTNGNTKTATATASASSNTYINSGAVAAGMNGTAATTTAPTATTATSATTQQGTSSDAGGASHNNLILLTEFFKAVGNGELDKLKTILTRLDELKTTATTAQTTSSSSSSSNPANQQHQQQQPQQLMSRSDLLNAGMADADGLTALSIAAGRKHKELTEFLAELAEVDVNKASESGITPLLMVAEVGWTDVMKRLLRRGAHVDAAPKGRTAEEAKIAGSTPLIGATKYNNPEAVKLLLDHAANPNHQNQSGISALMLASEQGFADCVRNLCEGGADVELAPSGKTALSMNLSGQTPLFCAAKEGHLDIVRYLLDRGANPNATNHYGVSVLWIPCQRGLLKIVELLLERGADPELAPEGQEAEERSISGWTPLYAAIKSRQYAVVKLLLAKGANPNAITSLGSTPFLLASEIGDLEVIKCFVEHGADLDYSPSGKEADELNITGQTALFMATLKEQNDVVQYLIERGSKVNVKNRYGVSPLLLCAEGGNETLVRLLVSVGADVNMSPSGDLAVEHLLAGQTPLYGAAKKGHYHICKYLYENGASVNAQTMVRSSFVSLSHFEEFCLLICFCFFFKDWCYAVVYSCGGGPLRDLPAADRVRRGRRLVSEW